MNYFSFFFFKKEKHFDNLNEQYNFRAGPSAEPSTLFDRLKKQKQKHWGWRRVKTMPQILVVKAWWWQMKPQALRLQPGDFPWRHRVKAHQKADFKMMPEAFSFVKIWGLIYLPPLPSPAPRLCCSVTKLCPTLWDPRTAAHQVPLSSTISQSSLKFMSVESVMPFNHLILCRLLLLLFSIFPSIRVR